MNDWTQIICSVGFPIAMAVYLIVVFNKTLNELRDAVLKLTTLIETMIKKNDAL